MNNKKGYTFIGTLLAILLITSAFLALFYLENINNANISNQGNATTDEYVHKMTAKERLHSLLSSNVSFLGAKDYSDLQENFVVTTKDEVYSNETLFLGQGDSFYLNNKTDVHVTLYGGEECSFNVQILNGDYDLLGNSGSNLYESASFLINGNKLYNEDNNETHYGTFTVSGSSCFAGASISYDHLVSRTIEVESNTYKRDILINNENTLNPIVKFN